MNDTGKRFTWLSTYAIAMALLEAVVVVYLRALLQVSSDRVALGPYVGMEIGREMATLAMLVTVGWLGGRRWGDRLAYGLFAFGLWDIWYYVWLKVLIDWPATLLDWDILFLIPLRWWGPVLSPVLVAALLCVSAALAVVRMERARRLDFTRIRIAAIVLGGVGILYVFMSDALYALLQGRADWHTLRPGPFKWPLFLAALALMAVPSLMATWPPRSASSRLRERSLT